jgi:hypothetical protein
MFSYIMLGTNDLPRAITFYDPLMEMLGYSRGGRNENVAWWGVFNGNNTTARTREHQACVRNTAKGSTALTSETPMATSWLSCITRRNPENDKPGGLSAPI